MMSLEKQSVELKPIAKDEIGYMWRTVASTNPLLNTDYETAALAITEEFNVLCTPEDVKSYDELLVDDEDYSEVVHGTLY